MFSALNYCSMHFVNSALAETRVIELGVFDFAFAIFLHHIAKDSLCSRRGFYKDNPYSIYWTPRRAERTIKCLMNQGFCIFDSILWYKSCLSVVSERLLIPRGIFPLGNLYNIRPYG